MPTVTFLHLNNEIICNHGELSSLTWLTNDASRHQFKAEMSKAKVS